MRLFIAVPLSQTMRDSLTSCQNDLYDLGVRGNFSPEENLHITLAFIGDYPDPDSVLDALDTVTFTPMTISIDGIGAFGNLWWVGITGSPALEALSRRIRRALSEKEIPFDRKRFSPHITILRKASVERIPPVQIIPASMLIDRVVLYRSDRGRNGMIYTEVGCIEAE